MTARDVQKILAPGADRRRVLDREVRSACGSDMMSDVLAFSKDHSVLLTGLCNPQVIRTAEMLDIVCLIFVRGKKPDQTILDMANSLTNFVTNETNGKHQCKTACQICGKCSCCCCCNNNYCNCSSQPPGIPNVFRSKSLCFQPLNIIPPYIGLSSLLQAESAV